MRKLLDESDFGIEAIDRDIDNCRLELKVQFTKLSASLETISNVTTKKELLQKVIGLEHLTEKHYNDINAISVEGIDLFEYGTLHTTIALNSSIEGISNFAKGITRGISKIIKKIAEIIKKMFKWIGKKLGIIKDDVADVKKTSTDLKNEESKVNDEVVKAKQEQEKAETDANEAKLKLEQIKKETEDEKKREVYRKKQEESLRLAKEAIEKERLAREKQKELEERNRLIEEAISKGLYLDREQTIKLNKMFATWKVLSPNMFNIDRLISVNFMNELGDYVHAVRSNFTVKDLPKPTFIDLPMFTDVFKDKQHVTIPYVGNGELTRVWYTKTDNNNIGFAGLVYVGNKLEFIRWSSKINEFDIPNTNNPYTKDFVNKTSVLAYTDNLINQYTKQNTTIKGVEQLLLSLMSTLRKELESYSKLENVKSTHTINTMLINMPLAVMDTYLSRVATEKNVITYVKMMQDNMKNSKLSKVK